MVNQQIIWTVLPNGIHREDSRHVLKLSVFISPRLRFDRTQQTGDLDEFYDFLDWPGRLQAPSFAIKLIVEDDVANPVETKIVTDPEPKSEFWQALFNKRIFVRSHEFQVRHEAYSSYAANQIVESLYKGYGDVGKASPYLLVGSETLKRAFQPIYESIVPNTGTLNFDRLDNNLENLSQDELASMHRILSDNLLRRDSTISFEEKLFHAIKVASALARSGAQEAVPIIPRTENPASAFAQLAAFHARVSSRRNSNGPQLSDASDDSKKIDFHQILSALGEYPHLLRKLGLVIDIEVDADKIPISIYGDVKTLRVAPIGNDAYTPNTKYLLDLRSSGSALPFPMFAAAPRHADDDAQPASAAHDLEIIGGLLNLGSPHQYDLIQIDTDGAAIKLMNTIEAIVSEEYRSDHPIDKTDETGAPSIRTSGIALVRSDNVPTLIAGMRRAEDHENALQRNNEFTNLFAEDLVRGYRIDIRRFPANFQFDSFGQGSEIPWLSLHKRIGTYDYKHPCTGQFTRINCTDEGFIQPTLVQSHAPNLLSADEPNPVYAPESLFHWKGWSLSASPPANPIDMLPQAEPAYSHGLVGLPQLEIDFKPPDYSLPQLRFGSYYQVRARTVDLAGNGPTIEEADAVVEALKAQGSRTPILLGEPKDFRYRRFEPISAPELVPREVFTEGESIDVMVIRSNGSTAAAYAASLGDPKYKGVNERHVAPPKQALMMIENHGLLDGAFGRNGNPGRYYNICRRENGSFESNFVTNLDTGKREYFPNIDLGTGETVTSGIRFVKLQGPDSGYNVHYEEQLRIPYLPDPLAYGAALFGLPGSNVTGTTGELNDDGELKWLDVQPLNAQVETDLGFLTKIHFGPIDKWPERLPFRLRLDEIAGDVVPDLPKWNNAERVLTVRLAPSQMCTIWIGSYPLRQDAEQHGLHDWWRKQVSESIDEKHFLNMAEHGALAMLTPPRKVTLVHAVQKPVKPPIEAGDMRLDSRRFPHGTVAYISGAFNIHARSTAKVDLFAEWEEQETSSEKTSMINTHVFEVQIPTTVLNCSAGSVPEPTTIPVSPPSNVMPIAKYDGAKRIEFLAPDMAATSKRYSARHEFGDTKYRLVTYRLVATTRFREYFPASITNDPNNLIQTSKPKTIAILSSDKPAAPEIIYIIPSFGWTIDEESNVIQSARYGGGLRVYLGATWYSSGKDEKLAVIDSQAPGFSRWGRDPILATPSSAINAIKPNGSPARAPGSEYDGKIYPFDVHFDEERGLWYSDIIFNVGSEYFPFKELALARYQKNSLNGMHVSPVVHAGMHQLAPDRMATLSFSPSPSHPDKRKLTITVSALAIRAASTDAETLAPAPVQPTVEVILEERDMAHQHWDDNLGWTLPNAAQQQQPIPDGPLTQGRLWTGYVLLPASPGSKQYRIVIQEFEHFPENDCPDGQAWLMGASGEAHRASSRLVYADTIRVD
ncbi:hypothetical protein [Methylobacter luteus]|uniref:hypothetical protein n=1 Tax=Methylobacter luteus TaxID=415 RepID=UPI0004019991|nr:hypothetical protein [Methylobacter luteus]